MADKSELNFGSWGCTVAIWGTLSSANAAGARCMQQRPCEHTGCRAVQGEAGYEEGDIPPAGLNRGDLVVPVPVCNVMRAGNSASASELAKPGVYA